MDWLVTIGGSIVDYAIAPVCEWLGHSFSYKRNIENLENQNQQLRKKKQRIEKSIKVAEKKGEEIHSDVRSWLIKAEEIDREAQNLCSLRSCPNLISRHQLSRKAKEMEPVIIREIQDAADLSSNASYRPPLQISIAIKGYEAFETRLRKLHDIMEALRDRNIDMVGVYGEGGVGKTMLAKEVARQAKDKLFSEIVITTVSQTPNYRKTQKEVAEQLGLEFDVTFESARASRLQERLRKEKAILVVVDDIWDTFDLERIGISFADDQKGCKILLTSRSQHVLDNQMNVQKSFKVEMLLEDEATTLFKKIVGDSLVNQLEYRSLVTQIVKECAGLPIAISVVASALRNKESSIWNNALRELKLSTPTSIPGMHEKVYSSIKWSYDFLKCEEAKLLLLLCGQFEEDAYIGIDDLMSAVVGLDWFRGITKLEEARNKVLTLVDNLKTSSLLLDVKSVGFVKMHDVIRDVVIRIATEVRQMNYFSNVSLLEESHNNRELKDSTTISVLCDNHLLIERLSCPKLELFSIFRSKTKDSQIPNQFFEETKELRVLNLHFVSLRPSSIHFLQNLATLCLQNCRVMEDIASIGELVNLKILSLSGSDLDVVPKQLQQLTRLQSLDLSYCRNLKVIERDVISKLLRLEELNVLSFCDWTVEEDNNERSNASLVEIMSLRYLTTLHLEIPNVGILPSNLFTKDLVRFELHIGPDFIDEGRFSFRNDFSSRKLRLRGVTKSVLEESGLKILLKRAESLRIQNLEIVNANELDDERGFPELKVLEIEDVDTVQYIINPTEQNRPCSAFQNLEQLSLERLWNLEKICNCELLTAESFSKLTDIDVRNCHTLNNLFPISNISRQLESIYVGYCSMMEHVFTYQGQGEDPQVTKPET